MTKRHELRREARAIFPASEAPRDFDAIELPFPERGGAALVPWSERKIAQAAIEPAVPEGARGVEAVASP